MTRDTHPIVDEATGTTGQGYTLTRVYKIDSGVRTDTVRVRIIRDFYAHQSFAVAEVLSADRTWTTVATDPPSNWHHVTPREAGGDVDRALAPLADRLADRAAAILA